MKQAIVKLAGYGAALLLVACGPGMKLTDLTGGEGAFVDFNVGYQRRSLSEQNAAAANPTDLMARLKYQGCMFDGLLTDPVEGSYDELLTRSACASLPRAIETWANPPNFAHIKNRIDSIERRGKSYDYGIFIAEAVSLTKSYADENGRPFNFRAMCSPGTEGHWGAGTCVPNVDQEEYRRYVLFVTKRAIDIGVTNILFGQTGHQDPRFQLAPVLTEIRRHAREQGRMVLIGQQPNGHQAQDYLRLFDYIVGPVYVGLDPDASPCASGTYPACQAILHNKTVVNRAHNLIVELDWASVLEDDTHKFARMTTAQRHAFLTEQAAKLRARGVGFTMPFRLWLTGDTSGQHCYGANPYNYSPDMNFGCPDEDVINQILRGERATPVVTTPVVVSTDTGGTTPPVVTPTPTVANPIATVVSVFVKYLDRDHDSLQSDVQGVSYWAERLKNGLSVAEFTAHVLASDEYFVRQAYKKYLRRSGATSEIAWWVKELESGRKTRAAVIADLNYSCSARIHNECQ